MEKKTKALLQRYQFQKTAIEEKICTFKNLSEEEWLYELIFCLITPQSKGKKCWEAVLELKKNNFQDIEKTLRTKTRFHKTKAKHIQTTLLRWPQLKEKIQTTPDSLILRDYLYENIKGMGMKEASHFLRNIGKSNNKLAILDRHILKNLAYHNIIKNPKKLDKKIYLKIEEKMKSFSKEIKIPLDNLDLLLWAKETGEIFK